MTIANASGYVLPAGIEITSGNVTTTVTDKSDLDGYRVGAGLEYNITPSAYVKGEYRYSHYGDLDGIDIDLDRHQLMAGFGFRF